MSASITNPPSTNSTRVAPLSSRYRDVLRDVIHTFVSTGEPVSSRTVSKHGRQSLSAATIRNVMADLEEMGLLQQPHSSAGRVPTKAAYRFYVENLMRWRQLSEREREHIEDSLAEAAGDIDHLMAVATHLLSDLSHQVGVVLTPDANEVALRSADFVSLGGRRVLSVIVSTNGFIDNLVIETDEELSREELVRISNYITRNFAGNRLPEIRDRLLQLMAAERDHVDRWLANAMALARRAVGGAPEQEVLVEGTTILLDRPELSEVDQVRRMLDTFADKARLVAMLNQCLVSDGVRVFLGEDTDVTQELDFSLVAAPYGVGSRPLGNLGIIGPSRMEYPRLVPLVHFLGEALSKALTSVAQE